MVIADGLLIMYIDYGFWAYVGEVARFILAIAWIAVIAVGAVHIMRYAIRIFEERVRWWK
jgi:hypothetical protein